MNLALSHGVIRLEQFSFRNMGECISLFVSICEIFQRRKFNKQYTFLAFLDLNKAYDFDPIYNILTKHNNIGFRDRCLQFINNLNLTSKAHTNFNYINFQKISNTS